MSAILNHVIRLLIGAAVVTSVRSQQTRILWPEKCDEYAVTAGAGPFATWIDEQKEITQQKCQLLCTKQRDCGGFYYLPDTDQLGSCKFYNINDDIIHDHLSEDLYWRATGYVWYSKTCPYDLGQTDLHCDTFYEHHEDTTISADYWLQNTYRFQELSLELCLKWCTLYEACVSVSYRQNAQDHYNYCYLYPVTVGELLADGRVRDVETYSGPRYTVTNYERHCSVPYTCRRVRRMRTVWGHTGARRTSELPLADPSAQM